MDKKIIEKIEETLKDLPTKLGVIGTVKEDGKPHVASVYFDFDENLNIYFITRSSTQKYTGTLQNSAVAFLTSAENPPRTVLLEGTVSEVSEPKEQELYFKRLSEYAKSKYPKPPFEQMMNAEIMVMKITPTKARLGDFDSERKSEMFQETTF